MANTVVRRIIFDGFRAVAVEVTGAAERTIPTDEIVLCAGAVKSPHLLMLSGVGPAPHLRKFGIPIVADLRGVGENLRDHPAVSLLWRRDVGDTSRIGATEGLPGLGGGACHLRFTAPSSTAKNDSRITAPKREATEDHSDAARFDRMYAGLYLAASRGELCLQSEDPDVQPRLNYRLLDEEIDRSRMRHVVELAIEISRQDGMSKIFGDLVDPRPDDLKNTTSLDSWMERRVRTSHHISSTAKMGPAADPEAVVDQHGRVHGVSRLRVADASIMPDCIRHNTNMTTIMIGERIADFLAHD
jgi:choline dehydrogenase-like flavoprotein